VVAEEVVPELVPTPVKPDTGYLYEQTLSQAQSAMDNGEVEEALNQYKSLIRRRRFLDDVITDLQDAIYRFPVDTTILEMLGDAYGKANRLQDALDTYTKAEDLLRQ
jgi:cytochrome c-type biogenesis protein CcmH/NrfG